MRPGVVTDCAAARTVAPVERARVGLRRGQRDGEVLALEGSARPEPDILAELEVAPEQEQPRAALARDPLRDLKRLGPERAGDDRPAGGHDRQLLLGDVALGRAQPARVLEAHVGETCTSERITLVAS